MVTKLQIKDKNESGKSIRIAPFNPGDKMEIFGGLATGDALLVRATDEIKPGTALAPKFQKK
nr:hypothetical protein [uncultured Chitinophaga sp.]